MTCQLQADTMPPGLGPLCPAIMGRPFTMKVGLARALPAPTTQRTTSRPAALTWRSRARRMSTRMRVARRCPITPKHQPCKHAGRAAVGMGRLAEAGLHQQEKGP